MINAVVSLLLRDQFAADRHASILSPDAARCLTAHNVTVALDTSLAIGFAVFSVASSCPATQMDVETWVSKTSIGSTSLVIK